MDLSKVSEEILRAVAAPVTTAREAREVIAALEEEFMLHPHCLGLAAPQVGLSKAVGIIRSREHGVFIDLINPKIISTEGEVDSLGEGCMSFHGRRFNIKRFRTIKIEYDRIWMPEGKWPYFTPPSMPAKTDEDPLVRSIACFAYDNDIEVFGGQICLAVQHEIDHTMGILLPYKLGAVEVPYTEDGIKAGPKVGRNDSCPCGSSKKYKKCCGK
jgi:peptide deformylase